MRVCLIHKVESTALKCGVFDVFGKENILFAWEPSSHVINRAWQSRHAVVVLYKPAVCHPNISISSFLFSFFVYLSLTSSAIALLRTDLHRRSLSRRVCHWRNSWDSHSESISVIIQDVCGCGAVGKLEACAAVFVQQWQTWMKGMQGLTWSYQLFHCVLFCRKS